jgi:hypothetical protein
MATRHNQGGASAPSTPQQPGLPAFIVYDHVPEGCFPHLVQRDECSPHARPGETVIIDPEAGDYRKGELYLIEWLSGVDRRQLAQISPVPSWMTILTKDRQPSTEPHYYIAGTKPQQPISLSGKPSGPPILFHDGPYSTVEIEKRAKGRVIGLLHSTFEEPKRIAGSERRA